jgi:hypothetical protein
MQKQWFASIWQPGETTDPKEKTYEKEMAYHRCTGYRGWNYHGHRG